MQTIVLVLYISIIHYNIVSYIWTLETKTYECKIYNNIFGGESYPVGRHQDINYRLTNEKKTPHDAQSNITNVSNIFTVVILQWGVIKIDI